MLLILPLDKRERLVQLLTDWIDRKSYTLLEAAELHGLLNHAAKGNRRGRTYFFALQNSMRRSLQSRYHQVRAYYKRNHKEQALRLLLPKHLHNRVDPLISREMASLLFHSRARVKTDAPLQSELETLRKYLADYSRPWQISLTHLIPRDPNFISIGDASGLGGGAYCDILEFWFDLIWTAKLRALIRSNKVHINVLEFMVLIIQLAAIITMLEDDPERVAIALPNGLPQISQALIRCDNSPSVNWAHKVSSKSERGQQFVGVLAELLDRTTMGVDTNHIAGIKNVTADMISRPDAHVTPDSLDPLTRRQQIFDHTPTLRSYRFFRPSRELCLLLESRMYTERWQGNPSLPERLGRFEVGSSITSSFVFF